MHLRIPAFALIAIACTGIAMAEPVKTMKERLSDKAADEQRVDNCKVPPERRGTRIRPNCPDKAAPAAPESAGSAPPR
jgi:hypothetical protein